MKAFKRHNYEKKTVNIVALVVLCLFVIVVSLTIGFSTMHSSFDIGEIAAVVRINKDIRITDITLDNTSNNAISNWEEYNTNSISSNITLPNSNSSVTYQVEITNLGNIEMGIFDITGIPSNLKYTIDNYSLKDMLCDSVNTSECKLGSKSYINITLSYNNNSYDSSNTDFNVKLDFDFKRFYNISYVNLDTTNLPTRAIESDNIEFYLNSPIPERIHFSGNTNASYNSTTGKITLPNISDDITVSHITISYFVTYDGSTNQLFNQFSSTNITSFSRNTTLSLSEVQAKVNNNTAYKISTNDNDANYPSDYDIYGWVDNDNFYWWSESNVVYFHPNTLGAFRQMTKLTNVDLTGTNTSLVKNFSHWFDKDAALTTINGAIDTSGLVLEYNDSYNYGLDNDENSSSEKGLAYMFNDCKVLTSINTSKIDTTNASDLKRMFGGCAKLKTIDVSRFNTSNAKSMYWMFRKTEQLTELDIRNFDTSKVESMFGMFVNASNIKTLYLGEKFDTSKVKKFNYMFANMYNIKTIYSYSDFNTSSATDSYRMFDNSMKIIGSENTLDSTPYDKTNVTMSYAKLAQNGTKGYFTPYNSDVYYTITYELDGGSADNPTQYNKNTRTFTLVQPQKLGYTFIGWTGSNGDTPQLDVTIEQGSEGNKNYVAHFEKIHEDLFPKVFSISGSCNFNGSMSNITGSTCVSDLDDHTNYTNSTYIDTNINLYNSENLEKDYEIYFEISNYNPSNQETMSNGNKQNTIMNSKSESVSGYPGVVVRRSGDKIEVKSFSSNASTWYGSVTSYKIARINKKIYYSVNGSEFKQLDDNTTYNKPFDLSVWFGASKDSSGNAFRHAKCTLSNIYIKLGTYS